LIAKRLEHFEKSDRFGLGAVMLDTIRKITAHDIGRADVAV
jgi:hypothetical protein